VKKSLFTFRITDLLAIGLVAVLAVSVFLLFFFENQSEASTVEVYQNGKLVESVPLTQNTELTITGKYTNTILIQDGKVSVSDSDCPGHDCMNSGAISSAGKSLVCLPNGVEVRITGTSSDVDFTVR